MIMPHCSTLFLFTIVYDPRIKTYRQQTQLTKIFVSVLFIIIEPSRNSPNPGRPTRQRGRTKSKLERYQEEQYELKVRLYSPNYGYEPYWNGDMKPSTKNKNLLTVATSTVRYIACGEECNYLYLRMGKICAHNVSLINYEGCWPHWYAFIFCYGESHGDIMGNYVTYENYCEFLDDQCTVVKHSGRLVFLHMGECRPQDYYFKPRYSDAKIVKDLNTYNRTANIVMEDWRGEYGE